MQLGGNYKLRIFYFIGNMITFFKTKLKFFRLCQSMENYLTIYWHMIFFSLQLFGCNSIPTWAWIRMGGLMQQMLRQDAIKKRK